MLNGKKKWKGCKRKWWDQFVTKDKGVKKMLRPVNRYQGTPLVNTFFMASLIAATRSGLSTFWPSKS